MNYNFQEKKRQLLARWLTGWYWDKRAWVLLLVWVVHVWMCVVLHDRRHTIALLLCVAVWRREYTFFLVWRKMLCKSQYLSHLYGDMLTHNMLIWICMEEVGHWNCHNDPWHFHCLRFCHLLAATMCATVLVQTCETTTTTIIKKKTWQQISLFFSRQWLKRICDK